MRCEYCSANNAPEEKFCTGCGSPLREAGHISNAPSNRPAQVGEIHCPHCGKMHPSSIWSCPETGGDLSSTSGASVPAIKTYASAKLVLDDSSEIPLTASGRTIGRDDFDRTASSQDLPFISRRHLLVSVTGNDFYIEDAGSVNGTLLNGAKLAAGSKQELKDGDQIELGRVAKLTFKQD